MQRWWNVRTHINLLLRIIIIIRTFRSKSVDQTVIVNNYTSQMEAVALETARRHLDEAVRNWYLGNIDEIHDWQSFRKAFSNTFMVEKSLTEKFQEVQQRYQGLNEYTQEYFFDKVHLSKRYNSVLMK